MDYVLVVGGNSSSVEKECLSSCEFLKYGNGNFEYAPFELKERRRGASISRDFTKKNVAIVFGGCSGKDSENSTRKRLGFLKKIFRPFLADDLIHGSKTGEARKPIPSHCSPVSMPSSSPPPDPPPPSPSHTPPSGPSLPPPPLPPSSPPPFPFFTPHSPIHPSLHLQPSIPSPSPFFTTPRWWDNAPSRLRISIPGIWGLHPGVAGFWGSLLHW